MRVLLAVAAACLAAACAAPSAPVEERASSNPAWSLAKGLAAPESAYYEPETDAVYVSNVAGSPFEKDGNGFIAKLSPQGAVLALPWLEGLNAPKGMRSWGGRLYVADIDELLEISLKEGRVLRRVQVPGAEFLNDVAADAQGTLYVSDTLAGKIFRVNQAGEASVLLEGEGLEAPNGLYALDGKLYAATWGHIVDKAQLRTDTGGHILEIDLASRAFKPIHPQALGNLDGLEPDGAGGWIVSDWVQGKVMRVGEKGLTWVPHEGLKGPADIGLTPQGLLLVPQMGADRLDAYSIK